MRSTERIDWLAGISPDYALTVYSALPGNLLSSASLPVVMKPLGGDPLKVGPAPKSGYRGERGVHSDQCCAMLPPVPLLDLALPSLIAYGLPTCTLMSCLWSTM